MTAIAIVGAGRGLGRAAAHRFGREGFNVALISRKQENVDRIADELKAEGINARGYVGDVRDHAALTQALDHAAAHLGRIAVLQYSPAPRSEFLKQILETTIEDLRAATDLSVLGPAVAIGQVLPSMIDRKSGTILLVNGSSAATPNSSVAGASTAFAAESAYGAMLHDAVASNQVNVRQLIIPGAIGGGDPLFEPAVLADHLWHLHIQPGPFRVTVGEGVA